MLLEPKGKRDRLFPKRQVLTSSPLLGLRICGERLDGIPVRVRLQHLVLTNSNTIITYTKMVYLDTMEEWQRQAKLLFQARPATVRKSTTHRMLAGQQR